MNYSQGKLDVRKASEHLICCARNKQSDGTVLMKDFEVLKTLYKGSYSKILLVRKTNSGNTDEKMVLKAFRYEEINIMDNFQRELSTNYTLSPHPNIVTSFNVSFMWEGSFIYVQEYAPFGDLKKHIKKIKNNRDENSIKLIIKQISSALEFMHLSFQIVHGNIKPENILIFNMDYTHVKLCDFGSAENEGNHVIKPDYEDPSYQSPEMAEILPGEKYYVSMKSDAWQLGILIYCCIYGKTPWNVPDITDNNYSKYYDYHKRKSLKLPESFKLFSSRLIRLLKRLLDPKPNKRYEVKEVFKYIKDDWLIKSYKNSNNLIKRRASTSDAPSVKYYGSYSNELQIYRPRSVSTSPGVTIRRSSISSTSTVTTNTDTDNSYRKKSIKSVKFNIPNEYDTATSTTASKMISNLETW